MLYIAYCQTIFHVLDKSTGNLVIFALRMSFRALPDCQLLQGSICEGGDER